MPGKKKVAKKKPVRVVKLSPKKVKKLTTPKKKIKLKYKNILIFFAIICLLSVTVLLLFRIPIKNIYIKGNTILSDQEIIDVAGLTKYPPSLLNTCSKIKSKLLENIYIEGTKVTKVGLSEVHIEIVENRPLFYNMVNKNTVLSDGKIIDTSFSIPTLINYVPDTIYDKFIVEMNQISNDILIRMSEIEYNPNDVDTGRFLVTMNDGNYVYLTLNKFESINNYIYIVKKFNHKKGILYLDSGEYFKVIEE